MAPENHRPRIKSSLPYDLIFYNILPRLPARSLLRFRFVCKQWHSFLTSPEFLNIHLRHITNDDHQNHHKLLVVSTTTPCNFHTIDCESPGDCLDPIRRLPFKVSHENMTILTSFNGLVCVGVTNNRKYDDRYSGLILWNPLTGDYKTLSKSNSCKDCYEVTERASGLYYTSHDDDYKLLRVTHDRNAYVYSLNFDSWRKLDSTSGVRHVTHLISESWGPSIVQNEKLYFLKQGKRRTIGHISNSIIRFDTKTEKFTKIATPCFGVRRKDCLNLTLLQKDQKIHLCLIYSFCDGNSRELGAKLWRMEDEDRDWTEVVTYLKLPSLYCFPKPLHLMRNGNWLTYCLHSGCHVYKLDPDRRFGEISYSNPDDEFDITPRGKYIETLESPNRLMRFMASTNITFIENIGLVTHHTTRFESVDFGCICPIQKNMKFSPLN